MAAMRFTLAALPSANRPLRPSDKPLTVQLKPSYGVPGEHSYQTDSFSLRSMLKRHTELSGLAITTFMRQIEEGITARLAGVELNDRVLREIGYFLD